ncbi:MAG: tetratricopeptide repeat protein [Nanoarchaeota archaeon]|nr:tetratricopeptide repeat protein [Nanoarchaeota archaeon]
MAEIIDFEFLKMKKNLEEIFDKAKELSAEAKLSHPSNVTDISDLLSIKKLLQLPPEILIPLVTAHREGKSAFDAGDYEKAIDHFGTLIQSAHLEPDPGIYFHLAFSLSKRERTKEAISICQEAITMMPQKANFYVILSNCYTKELTLEGFDNALYCITKGQNSANEDDDYVALLTLLLNQRTLLKYSVAIVGMEHNFDIDDGSVFSYAFTLKNDVKSYDAKGEIPTVIFGNKEINTKLLPKEEIFPPLLKNLRFHLAEKMGKPVYFAPEILEKEGINEEDVSYRNFEKE